MIERIDRREAPTQRPRNGASARVATCVAAGALLLLAPTPGLVPSVARAEAESAVTAKEGAAAATRAWNWHGETTVVWQGHGSLRSPYQSENSLNGGGQGRETFSATGSLGLRLWPGGEFYINPEAFQGFGLAGTHGLGGFSNGEAQKGGSLEPVYYVARAFYRHTFGFGGETETVTDEFNQLPGSRAVSRLTVTVGRFALSDVFDRNSYARDPRDEFLNYSVWAAGAFDYAADQRGYGGGVVLDFNHKAWALRLGYGLLPVHSNAQRLSFDIGRQGQYLGELELRWKALERPGILRVLGWVSRANAGSYREALAVASFDAEESIQATRRIRTQFGYALNLEQSLTDNLGFFARWSWRDAASDVMSWTDIDRSLSFGWSLKGKDWGRPRDTVGLAFAFNGLSDPHADYFAAGGVGVTVGDGRLNRAIEQIVETYYAIGLTPNMAMTLDYQYVTNPAYNADRGPVSIFAMRWHAHY